MRRRLLSGARLSSVSIVRVFLTDAFLFVALEVTVDVSSSEYPLADGPFANEDREKSRPVVYDWEERTLPDLGRQDVEDPTALTPFRTFPERLSA